MSLSCLLVNTNTSLSHWPQVCSWLSSTSHGTSPTRTWQFWSKSWQHSHLLHDLARTPLVTWWSFIYYGNKLDHSQSLEMKMGQEQTQLVWHWLKPTRLKPGKNCNSANPEQQTSCKIREMHRFFEILTGSCGLNSHICLGLIWQIL